MAHNLALGIALCLLGPIQLLSQIDKSAQLMLLGGIFAPQDDQIQNIYGDSPAGQLSLAFPLGQTGRIRFGANLFRASGDPFFDFDDFDAGQAAHLLMVDLSFTLESHALTKRSPLLYFGIGIDYVFSKEEIAGVADGNGRTVGAHVSFMPEIKLSRRVSFVSEARYRFLEVDFRSGRRRYQFDLSGANLLFGLGYDLH